MEIKNSQTWNISLRLRHRIGLLDQAYGFCRTFELTKWLYRNHIGTKIIHYCEDTPETLILLGDITNENTFQIQSWFLPNFIAKNYLPSKEFLDAIPNTSVCFRNELELEIHQSFEVFFNKMNRHSREILEDLKYLRLDIKNSKANLGDLILGVSNFSCIEIYDCLSSLFLADHAAPTLIILHDRMDNDAEPIAIAILYRFAENVGYIQDVIVDEQAKLGLRQAFKLKILEFAVRNGFSKLITKDLNFLPLNMGEIVTCSRVSNLVVNNSSTK